MKPLVSILIPAYNAESWIADTIESALSQTWDPKEIIVVDDGSTDHTVAVAEQFTARGVSVVRQAHQCAAAARNHAFSLSRGDYIQWLDADDLLAPDKISLQLHALTEQHTERTLLSSPWGRFIYRPQKADFGPSALWCDLSPLECLLRKMEGNIYMQTSSWLVSRRLAEKAGPWNTRLLSDDDGEYFCRVILASDAVKFVPGAKVYYRWGFDSLAYIGSSKEKIEAQFHSLHLCITHILTFQDNPRVRQACLLWLQRWFIHFYPEHAFLVTQASQLANSLGGTLEPPKLSWKYSWICRLFGWPLAKRAQTFLPKFKLAIRRWIDRALFYAFDDSRIEMPRTQS